MVDDCSPEVSFGGGLGLLEVFSLILLMMEDMMIRKDVECSRAGLKDVRG